MPDYGGKKQDSPDWKFQELICNRIFVCKFNRLKKHQIKGNMQDSPDWKFEELIYDRIPSCKLNRLKNTRLREISNIHQNENLRNLFLTEFHRVNSTDLEQISDRFIPI